MVHVIDVRHARLCIFGLFVYIPYVCVSSICLVSLSKVEFIAGKGLALSLGQLSITIPSTGFEIKRRALGTKLHCSGHVAGALSGMQVIETINITAIGSGGTPHVTPSSAWTWGKLAVGVTMTHSACKVIKDVVQVRYESTMYAVCRCT